MKIIIIYKDIIVPERVVIDSYKKDTNFFNFRKIIKNNIEQKKLNFNSETPRWRERHARAHNNKK